MIPRSIIALLLIATFGGCSDTKNESKMPEADFVRIRGCFENCVGGEISGFDPHTEQSFSGDLSVEICRSSTTLFCLESMLQDGVLVEKVTKNHKVGNYIGIDVRSIGDEVWIKLYDMPFFVGFSIAVDQKEEFFCRLDSRAKMDRLMNRLKKNLKETVLGEKTWECSPRVDR